MSRTPEDHEPWYESSNPDRVARGLAARAALWVTAVIVFLVIAGVALWGFRVFTSDVKGRGDAARAKNAGINRVAAQERFETMHKTVVAADQRIDVFAAALKADPADPVARTNYTGAVTFCQQAAADYDAEARKYSARDFRATDLPDRIDPANQATDCKGTP